MRPWTLSFKTHNSDLWKNCFYTLSQCKLITWWHSTVQGKGSRACVPCRQFWRADLSQGKHLDHVKEWISCLSSGSLPHIFFIPVGSWHHLLNGFQWWCGTVCCPGSQSPRDGGSHPVSRIKCLHKLLAFLSLFWFSMSVARIRYINWSTSFLERAAKCQLWFGGFGYTGTTGNLWTTSNSFCVSYWVSIQLAFTSICSLWWLNSKTPCF